MTNNGPIALIGPYLSGKTTIRHLLAQKLNRPHLGLVLWHDEEIVFQLFQEAGWTEEALHQHVKKGGDGDLYMQQYEVTAIESAIQQYSDHVIEIAASWPVTDDPELHERILLAVQQCQAVVFILPSPDHTVAYHKLRERYWRLIDIDLNEQFIRNPSYQTLANHTIFTNNKTPTETAAEIISRIDLDDADALPIMLIGPPAAGKSTISNLLAAYLNLPIYALDVEQLPFPSDSNYDANHVNRLYQTEGIRGVWRYQQPFIANHFEQILQAGQASIIDLGAGHAVFENENDLSRVAGIVAPYPHIYHLQPTADKEESIRILKERPRSTINGKDTNLYLIEHPAYREMATITLYTNDQTPEETCEQLIAILKNK